jgi:hypothetical protein
VLVVTAWPGQRRRAAGVAGHQEAVHEATTRGDGVARVTRVRFGAVGVAPGQGPGGEKKLREDIAACEAYQKAAKTRGPFPATLGARPEGGWGDPDFEWCMNSRDWRLKFVRGDAAQQGSAASEVKGSETAPPSAPGTAEERAPAEQPTAPESPDAGVVDR